MQCTTRKSQTVLLPEKKESKQSQNLGIVLYKIIIIIIVESLSKPHVHTRDLVENFLCVHDSICSIKLH